MEARRRNDRRLVKEGEIGIAMRGLVSGLRERERGGGCGGGGGGAVVVLDFWVSEEEEEEAVRYLADGLL